MTQVRMQILHCAKRRVYQILAFRNLANHRKNYYFILNTWNLQ
jgi:hypothetical protein